MSVLEDRLMSAIVEAGLPTPEREGRLVPGRQFRSDFFWPGPKVACELEGAIFVHGRHSRGAGYRSDCEKYNLLQLLGWVVLRVTDREVRNGDAVRWIAEALDHRMGLELREVED